METPIYCIDRKQLQGDDIIVMSGIERRPFTEDLRSLYLIEADPPAELTMNDLLYGVFTAPAEEYVFIIPLKYISRIKTFHCDRCGMLHDAKALRAIDIGVYND